jgi:peptidoglycan/LPS O-acetylase OafA/YrhL
MEEIAVVRRRTRIWPIVLMLILIALVVLAILWMTGYFQPREFNFNVLNVPAATAPAVLG